MATGIWNSILCNNCRHNSNSNNNIEEDIPRMIRRLGVVEVEGMQQGSHRDKG